MHHVHTSAEILKDGNMGYCLAHCVVPGNKNSLGYNNSLRLCCLLVQKLSSSIWVYIGIIAGVCKFGHNQDGCFIFLMLVWVSADSVPCCSMSDSSVILGKVLFPYTLFLLPIVCLVCVHSKAFQGKTCLLLLGIQDLMQWKDFLS